jgi:cytoskeletal protein RodZ
MKEFFENLKQIRESKNISLEEISKKSRLPLKYLKDIENGALENLPKGYDRIFFKRYLKEIDEDKEEIWKDFNLFFGTGTLEKDMPYSSDVKKIEKPENIEMLEEEKGQSSEKKKKPTFIEQLKLQLNLDKLYKYFWIIITAIVLGVIGYFAYQQYLFVKNSPMEVKEVSVSDYISEMQRQDSILTQQLTKNTEIGDESAGSLRVELHSIERTWIREIRDQKDTTDYILIPGLKRKIEASQSVQLMLGRADGVKIWLNNDSLGVMGKSDEVILRLLLTNKGIEEKRVKRVTPKVTDTSSVTT